MTEERIAVVVSVKDDGAKSNLKGIGKAATDADTDTSAAAKGISKDLASVGTAAGKAEQRVGAASKGIAKDVAGVGAATDKAADKTVAANRRIADSGEKTSSTLKTAALTAAAAIGAAAVKFGASALLGQADTRGKLQAQLDLSTKDAEHYGKLAGELYSQNYGGSVDEVADALGRVKQASSQLRVASDDDLRSITKGVLNVSSVFGEDLNKVLNVTGKLLSNGLAPNAQAALDIVVKGMQSGVNGADDLLDTFEEYPPQFQKLGVSGEQALGLLSQGLKAGARNTDIVADAIKEFSIRAIDGSTLTAQGFKQLGLDAGVMGSRIAAGGKSANDALDLTLDRLRAIPDPVKRSQVAVALFGTQAEDLGQALFSLDPSKAVAALGAVSGAADRLDQAVGTTPRARIDAFMRSLSQGATNAAATVIDEFGKLPHPVQIAVGVIGGIATTAVAAAAGLGTIAPKVKAARTQLESMGRAGQVASVALGKIGKSLAIGGGALAGLELLSVGIDKIASSFVHAAPGVQTLTQHLLAFSAADLGGQLKGAGANLENLGKEFERSTGDVSGFSDAVDKAFSKVGPDSVQIRQAREDIGALDAALAGLVSSGHADKATAAFEQLAITAGRQGVSIDLVEKALPQYRDAVAGVAVQSKLAADAQGKAADASGKVGAAAVKQVQATDELGRATKTYTGTAHDATGQLVQYASAADLLRAKLDALNEASLDSAEADIAYRNAVAGVTESLKNNGKTFDLTNQKGRDNTSSVLSAIRAAETHAAAVAKQTGNVDKGTAALKADIEALRGTAGQSKTLRAEIDRLIAKYAQTPPHVKTKAELDAEQAKKRIADLQRRINAVHGKNVVISATSYGIDQVQREINRINGRNVVVSVTTGGGTSHGGTERRAAGGPVRAGQPYVVGEDAPELFVPDRNGRIIPPFRGVRTGLGQQRAYADSTGAGGRVQLDPEDRALLRQVVARAAEPLQVVGELRARGHDLVAVMDRVSTERARR